MRNQKWKKRLSVNVGKAQNHCDRRRFHVLLSSSRSWAPSCIKMERPSWRAPMIAAAMRKVIGFGHQTNSAMDAKITDQACSTSATAFQFERAASLDSSLAPLASYYAGRAWQEEQNREKAEVALRQARERAPGSDWATQADIGVPSLSKAMA